MPPPPCIIPWGGAWCEFAPPSPNPVVWAAWLSQNTTCGTWKGDSRRLGPFRWQSYVPAALLSLLDPFWPLALWLQLSCLWNPTQPTREISPLECELPRLCYYIFRISRARWDMISIPAPFYPPPPPFQPSQPYVEHPSQELVEGKGNEQCCRDGWATFPVGKGRSVCGSFLCFQIWAYPTPHSHNPGKII